VLALTPQERKGGEGGERKRMGRKGREGEGEDRSANRKEGEDRDGALTLAKISSGPQFF